MNSSKKSARSRGLYWIKFKLVIEEEMGNFPVGDVLGDEYSDFGLSDGEEEDD